MPCGFHAVNNYFHAQTFLLTCPALGGKCKVHSMKGCTMLTYHERKARGLRNKDIAAKTGIDQSQMSQIRNGATIPSLTRALIIYDACGEQYGALKNLDATQIVALRAITAAQA